MSFIRDLTATLPSLLVIPVGLAVVKRFAEQTGNTVTAKDTKPAPLIPTPVTPAPVTPAPLIPTAVEPKTYAKPAKPITPFKTLQERAEEAAFIARQAKMTREQLLGRFGL